jgi:acyl-lipid omega-6 desaturase (Delta-12 desaturase)
MHHHGEGAVAPCPSDLSHLRPTDRQGLMVTTGAIVWTAGGIWLSTRDAVLWWLLGQALLGVAFVQWFVILHEAGHDTLFHSRRLNTIAGSLAGAMSLIPYRCWRRVHGRHHKWTGWQDLDPTTESLVPRERRLAERAIVNLCWRLWIPLFSVVYRIQNYWNLSRLRSMFERNADRAAMQRDALALLVIYAVLVAFVGPTMLLRTVGIGLLLSLVLEDLLLLSQHTHVPQNVSDGEAVRPFPAIEQGQFTRSLRLPAAVSRVLLHFDAHELHHMYPFVPGYHLHRIPYQATHEVDWWTWVMGARRMKGEVLLYQSRLHTGSEL